MPETLLKEGFFDGDSRKDFRESLRAGFTDKMPLTERFFPNGFEAQASDKMSYGEVIDLAPTLPLDAGLQAGRDVKFGDGELKLRPLYSYNATSPVNPRDTDGRAVAAVLAGSSPSTQQALMREAMQAYEGLLQDKEELHLRTIWRSHEEVLAKTLSAKSNTFTVGGASVTVDTEINEVKVAADWFLAGTSIRDSLAALMRFHRIEAGEFPTEIFYHHELMEAVEKNTEYQSYVQNGALPYDLGGLPLKQSHFGTNKISQMPIMCSTRNASTHAHEFFWPKGVLTIVSDYGDTLSAVDRMNMENEFAGGIAQHWYKKENPRQVFVRSSHEFQMAVLKPKSVTVVYITPGDAPGGTPVVS